MNSENRIKIVDNQLALASTIILPCIYPLMILWVPNLQSINTWYMALVFTLAIAFIWILSFRRYLFYQNRIEVWSLMRKVKEVSYNKFESVEVSCGKSIYLILRYKNENKRIKVPIGIGQAKDLKSSFDLFSDIKL
jgi:hypothetical protein